MMLGSSKGLQPASSVELCSPTQRRPTQEEKVLQACTDGIIDEEQCKQQLLSLRSIGCDAIMQHDTRVRKHADGKSQIVLCVKEKWQDALGPFPTEKEALAVRRKVEHGGNAGLWAWNQQGCRKWLHCNFHVNCPVMLRVRQSGQGYFLQVTEGIHHGLQIKEKERSNAALTRVQKEAFVMRTRAGASPRQMQEDDTMQAIDNGGKKLDDGGMEGV